MRSPYIEGDNAKITRKDLTHVNVLMYDGQEILDVEPRRLFPISGLRKYITLLDKDEKEVAIISGNLPCIRFLAYSYQFLVISSPLNNKSERLDVL